ELEFRAPGHGNPFTGVKLGAVFTSPSGESIAVDGFFDGDGAGGQEGDVYKIRFAPSETGLWKYRTFSSQSGLDGDKGRFECVESGLGGPLVRNEKNPWYLKWSDGGYFFESGANDPESFLASGFATREERFRELDYLASAGCNILYFGMVNAGPGDGGPGEKVHPWLGGPETPDFNLLCLDFMNRLEGVLDYMESLGIVAHLVFYVDDCSLISRAISPAQEEFWFRYTVARFGSYSGLIWNLAEEYEEAFDAGWCEKRAALIKERDPIHHPVTVHQLSADSFAFAGSVNFDLTALQFNFTDPDSLNSMILKVRGQVEQAGRPVPVSLIEWTPLEPGQADLTRRGIWAIATAGGTYQIFNKDQGTVELDFSKWEAHWRYAAILKELIETLPFERMGPDNSLVTRGYCLALPGHCYLVYQPRGGEFSLTLSSDRDTYYGYWLDPRLGGFLVQGEIEASQGRASFKTPDDKDWALLVTISPRGEQ
ncbi:MAG: DUF5060 domain-containing protein, partial [Gemmatimonadota bacterium]|nr:DUF5060 domain-containing protein [Gemmatimonadota bacterium]